ncbi:MAG: restriction endonuclease subunit S, partial [Anaerolineaceae bacterium 4572_5.1]
GGGTPKTSEERYWDGSIPWLSGADVSGNHKGFVLSSAKRITEVGLNNSSTKLLPQFSTVISARGTVGKYCLLARPMAFSQTSYGVTPRFEGSHFFTYLLIDHSVNALLSAAYGSVFDTITTRTFQNFVIHLPPEDEILYFEQKVRPYFLRMKLNKDQIHTLEKLRDTLLPKLMSGKVRDFRHTATQIGSI